MPVGSAVWKHAKRIDVHNHVWGTTRGQTSGTGAPFKHVKPAFLKLDVAELSDETRERVLFSNGRALLQLEG